MRFSIPLKVACGYVLTALLLIGAIAYVYDCSMLLIDKSDMNRWQQHRVTTDYLISKLFETEAIASTATIGGQKAFADYEQTVSDALFAIAVLDSIAIDSLQHVRLDSLATLIVEKKNVIGMLVNVLKDDDEMLNYYTQLDKIIKENDTITNRQQTVMQIVNEETSYIVNEPKHNFFKRIADVFSPGHSDTVTVSNEVKVMTVDTITTIVDDNTGKLSSAYDSINRERIESDVKRIKAINKQSNQLRYASVELGLKVSQLINRIEIEERNSQNAMLDQEYEIRKNAAVTTTIIAVIAMILAVIFFILTWRDVARSNRYRKELEIAKKRAEDLLELRQRLMLTITHDIKAPVGAILGHLELMTSGAITPEQRDAYLTGVRDSSSHLLALVNSLLDYHRLDMDKMDVHYENFNPSALLLSVCDAFQPLATKKGLDLQHDISPSANCECNSDAFRIRQIVENLLSNALKFTDTGFVSITAAISNETLAISVADSGCGMDDDEQQLIFKEFTRLGSAQGREGVGLGLSITSKLVSLLEGEINVCSEKGNGTTFNVLIPIRPAENVVEKIIDTEIAETLNILVIDDDPIQLNLTDSMLHKLNSNWIIVCCNNPDEAIAKLNDFHFDVVFTDIQMPSTNGFELLDQIKHIEPDIPVVALTARSDMNDEAFSAILHKPYNLADIRMVLCKVIPCPEIDFKALTAFAGDDKQAANEILETFLSETTKNKHDFVAAAKSDNKEEVCGLVHKMLPTFTMIHAPLINAFKELEHRRNNKQWQNDDYTLISKVEESIETVLQKLQKLLNQKKDDYENNLNSGR